MGNEDSEPDGRPRQPLKEFPQALLQIPSVNPPATTS